MLYASYEAVVYYVHASVCIIYIYMCCCWPRTTSQNSKAALRSHAFDNHYQLKKCFRFRVNTIFEHIFPIGIFSDRHAQNIVSHAESETVQMCIWVLSAVGSLGLVCVYTVPTG